MKRGEFEYPFHKKKKEEEGKEEEEDYELICAEDSSFPRGIIDEEIDTAPV